MIQDCLEIFKYKLDKYDDERLVLDNYVPKDGTYILIEMSEPQWNVKDTVAIRFNKKDGKLEGKTSSNYRLISTLDYYSKLIAMNKPVDPQKVIHSNNYLSFAVKKESIATGKLSSEVLDLYYEILKNPIQKYSKPNVRKLYEETEKMCGEVDRILAEQIHQWVRENLSKLEIDTSKKDYLKLYFIFPDEAKTKELYRKEGSWYTIPNIYNNNDFNCLINDEIYGLPNDNMGMNSKKVFLANKSKRVQVPYLLNREQVMLQAKFYDFLYGQASKGNLNIYFDENRKEIIPLKNGESPTADMSGYFIRLKKGMEAEIHNVDAVPCYNPHLQTTFFYQQYLETDQSDNYGMITDRKRLELLIDDVLFGKSLISNYFTDVGDITIKDGTLVQNLIMSRELLFSWFYKNDGVNPWPVLQKCSKTMIYNSINKGYWKKTRHQINLLWSLKDYFKKEEIMYPVVESLRKHINEKDDWMFDNDEEYYFAIGQMVSYFINKSKAAKKPLSFINPFLNAKDDDMIKSHLEVLFKKYDYDIMYMDLRVKRLFSNVMIHKPVEKIDTTMIAAGVAANNLIFEKKEAERNDE